MLATAIPLALAAPVIGLQSGEAGVSTLPDRLPAKQGYLALNAEFPGETTEPVEVASTAPPSPRRSARELSG